MYEVECTTCGKIIRYDKENIVTDLVHKMVVCPYCDNTTILTLYLCDPEKHKDCHKTSCQKDCFCTIYRKYAKEPIVEMDDQEVYNEYEERLKGD